jgi:hypothetical protein
MFILIVIDVAQLRAASFSRLLPNDYIELSEFVCGYDLQPQFLQMN